ncbi:hypothetical protein [Streptomyces sp. rh34]|uniref:hypothetical protein n=1 Tax=Streptomyces sp. rh34 TaxID=2034272 RepID=UPI001180A8FB|nr:hypothetical protein [Streptomyces sp. rh34]
MTAAVRQLRRTVPHVAAQPTNSSPDTTEAHGLPGGDCLCGRGETIGTCIVTGDRLWFRAFRDSPAAYHFQRVTDWACVDCVADAALDVATGVIRNQMREQARERAAEMNALMRTKAMRQEAGLPPVSAAIPEGCDWPEGER